MGANDGTVVAFRQLLDNGPRRLRYNIALVSDGYTAAETPQFRADCKAFLRQLFWTPPFSSLRCTFNVFALEVSSTQSGIDNPVPCGGDGAAPSTFFDSTLCGDGRVQRVASYDAGLLRNRLAGFLPEVNATLLVVNSPIRGGTTHGSVSILTRTSDWLDIALHEFGHILGLADEYACYACDGTDSGRRYDEVVSSVTYGPLSEPNVTKETNVAKIPWGTTIASSLTPLPIAPGTVPAGTVALFEGAKYYALGLYRGEEFCKMLNTSYSFCAVCRAAIILALAPWTPSTSCVTPTATMPSATIQMWKRWKVLVSPGRGGYRIATTTTSNLPGNPDWRHRIDGGSWKVMPADRIVTVPINQPQIQHVYNHTLSVEAEVGVDDLDFWVPATSTFTTASADVAVALREPNPAASTIDSDYDDPGNVRTSVATSITFGGVRAGNGWISIGTREFFTRLAVRLHLDDGHFGPDDDPTWKLQHITWTPTPSQTSGLSAFYDLTFDARGLCWLNSDATTVVDPNVGFSVAASGRDTIGQSFNATGHLVPTHVVYRQSISTIEEPNIPPWEWPVLIETPETILDIVVDGTPVTLTDETLTIGDLEIEVRDAGH